jgi:hypothetical protein
MTSVVDNTVASNNYVGSIINEKQKLTEYTDKIKALTFTFNDKHQTTTKHVLSIPEFINSDELINTFMCELSIAVKYCTFTLLPMNQLCVELNDSDVDSPYKTFCAEHITKLYKSLDSLLLSYMYIDVYTKKSTINIYYNGDQYKQCVSALGINRMKTLILSRIRFHKFIVSSCSDVSELNERGRNANVGWEIEFTY